MSKAPVRVVVTGGAGQIAYSLVPTIASGSVFGADQPVVLVLLDIAPALEFMKGIMMELEDLACPLLAGIVGTADADEAFTDADYAIFLGAFPRKEGMERKDVMSKNVGIFNAQGSALAKAKSTVRAVVVGNPANTNAAILAKAAGIAPTQISALTRLDHNRATYMVAAKCGASCGDVEGVYIWGNHSSTQYPDVSHCKVKGAAPALDAEWKSATFEPTVQKRGAAVIAARKASSAASAAKAVCDHMRDWALGAPKPVSMGVWSDGNPYGVPEGLYYSFPVKLTGGGSYEIVGGLAIDDHSRKMMDASAAELVDELALANSLLK